MLRLIWWIKPLSALAMILAAACGTANAQTRPLVAVGEGVVDWIPIPKEMGGRGPAVHTADGVGTLLGLHHARGVVRVDEFTSPLTARFSSAEPVVFRARDGDELHMNYAGNVELIPLTETTFISVWDAVFTPVLGSSTGRFRRVTGGSARFLAVTEPFELADTDVRYGWVGDGSLVFGRP